MDLRKLKTLIDLVSESNISELEITEADGKVRIVKSDGAGGVPMAMSGMSGMSLMPVMAPTAPTPAAVVEAAAPVQVGQSIKSPMVGTFYRSSGPNAKPFVEVGQQIKAGAAICIIEAMKIMNEIDAETSGTIIKILCENGQAVEFGQPLFVID